MAKVLYKPFGVLLGVLAGSLASTAFKQIWKLVRGEDDAPKATEGERSWAEVLPAAALQGAVFALVKATIDRGGARGFEKLTGVWPGD